MSAEGLARGNAPAGLRQRVARAGSWVLIGHFTSQGVRLATNVLLARMLSPDVFGLMSVVYILVIGMSLFSDLGINRIVVQSPRGREPDLLDTAWTIQVIRGLGLGALCFVVAGVIGGVAHLGWFESGTVYRDARLPWIVAAFSAVAILAGFESIRIGLAKRDMQMRLLTKIDIASQIAAAVTMIATAWWLHSIWALVVGAVVTGAVRCGLGQLVLPGHRERLRIVPSAASELLGNGKWIMIASILGFVAINGDRLMLGGMIDARSFGLYTVAFMLVNVLQVVASTLCVNVAYPAIAEVYRERRQDFARTLQKFQWLYDGVVTFLAAVLMVAGPAVISVLYDSRYQGAGWIMVVLSIGAIGLRYQLVEQSYQATGNPKFVTLASMIRLIALVVGIYVGQWAAGVHGAIVGIAASQFASWPLAWWFKARYQAFTWKSEAMLFPSVVAGSALGWLLSMLISHFVPAHFLHH